MGRQFEPFSHADYDIACGGTEVPMLYSDGKTYLFVWNKQELRHEYYVFDDDVFISEKSAPWLTETETYSF
jgi:hypothetical protein